MIRKINHKAIAWSLLAVSVLFLAYQLLRQAGVVEDAYITFRVIDNFVNGYGLRWNVYERVQTYTNPLWMFLHIPFYALWQNIFYITLALSFACTFGAIWVAYKTIKPAPITFAALFVLPLAFSTSVISNSATGLENPLSHLCFALFGWAVLRERNSRYYWFCVSLFAALSMVNRLDMALICLPALAYLTVYKTPRREEIWQVLLGAVPLMLWLAFSFWYYGFIYPNTKYAKLGAGIGLAMQVRLGMGYLANMLMTDLPGFMALLITVLCAPFYCFHQWKQNNKMMPVLFIIAGIMAYSVYVVMVGGSFIAGRFWSLSVFSSVWTLCYLLTRWNYQSKTIPVLFLTLIAASIFAQNTAKNATMRFVHEHPQYFRLKVDKDDCVIAIMKPRVRGAHVCRYICHNCSRNNYAILPGNKPQLRYRTQGGAGRGPYMYGPNLTFVDTFALTDALLARLPSIHKKAKAGHHERIVPKGYMHAVKTGNTKKMHPALAKYYEKLRIITQGDLLSWERFKTIVKFNLGHYDKFRKRYLQPTARQPMSVRKKPSGQSMRSKVR